jgi:translation initiation factor IF-3
MINEAIRDREVRVIDDQGNQLGIMSARDAQKIAREKNLDLVKIAPKAKPPVCKIIDYGKFRYEQAKKDKENKKKQTIVSIKEVRMSPNIEQHDIDTKMKNGRKFLSKGDKLKISVRFRGREMAHTSIGRDMLLRFAEELSDIADIEKRPKMEGRSMTMFLVPKKENN